MDQVKGSTRDDKRDLDDVVSSINSGKEEDVDELLKKLNLKKHQEGGPPPKPQPDWHRGLRSQAESQKSECKSESEPTEPTETFRVGDRVRIIGLVNRKDLNGLFGRIIKGAQQGRYGVELEGLDGLPDIPECPIRKSVRIKAECLTKVAKPAPRHPVETGPVRPAPPAETKAPEEKTEPRVKVTFTLEDRPKGMKLATFAVPEGAETLLEKYPINCRGSAFQVKAAGPGVLVTEFWSPDPDGTAAAIADRLAVRMEDPSCSGGEACVIA